MLSNQKAAMYLQAVALLEDQHDKRTNLLRYRLWALLETNATVRTVLQQPHHKRLHELAETYTRDDLLAFSRAVKMHADPGVTP